MRDAFYIVLTKEFVEDAVKILVTRFIPLNPSDLEDDNHKRARASGT